MLTAARFCQQEPQCTLWVSTLDQRSSATTTTWSTPSRPPGTSETTLPLSSSPASKCQTTLSATANSAHNATLHTQRTRPHHLHRNTHRRNRSPIHLHQRTRNTRTVDAGLLAKVADELARLQTERAHYDFMARRTFIIQLAKEFQREDSLARRRSMRYFEHQYSLTARRVLYDIAETERTQSRAARNP